MRFCDFRSDKLEARRCYRVRSTDQSKNCEGYPYTSRAVLASFLDRVAPNKPLVSRIGSFEVIVNIFKSSLQLVGFLDVLASLRLFLPKNYLILDHFHMKASRNDWGQE